MRNFNETLRMSMLNIPDFVNSIRLSDKQINLVRSIQQEDYGMTTHDIANELNITTQNASTQLSKLWRKGYLNRTKRSDVTGGDIYEYSIANELRFIDIPQR